MVKNVSYCSSGMACSLLMDHIPGVSGDSWGSRLTALAIAFVICAPMAFAMQAAVQLWRRRQQRRRAEASTG